MQAPDREQQLEYNLTVLKRRDGAISKILDMAGHVVLYQFNEDSKAWDRKGVEGSLFVVERSGEPRHQFVVLNRLSSENLVETVDADFQTELTDQFLLYRNLKQEILGVWFYSPPERTAISELLTSLANASSVGDEPSVDEPATKPDTTSSPSDATEPSDGTAAGNVAQFFNMAAMSQAVAQQAGAEGPPPMPANAAKAGDIPLPMPTPAPAASKPMSGGAPVAAPSRPPVDMDALKKKLANQLRSLVDDDAFLSLLANEYLRQQQRALQQAQQARQKRTAAADGSAAPTSMPDAGVPAHLASLQQQQASM